MLYFLLTGHCSNFLAKLLESMMDECPISWVFYSSLWALSPGFLYLLDYKRFLLAASSDPIQSLLLYWYLILVHIAHIDGKLFTLTQCSWSQNSGKSHINHDTLYLRMCKKLCITRLANQALLWASTLSLGLILKAVLVLF